MTQNRLAWRSGIIVFGFVWAGALLLLGLARLTQAGTMADELGGVAAIAAAQFVCMVLVADRIRPPRRPGLALALELAAVAVAVVAAAAIPFSGGA